MNGAQYKNIIKWTLAFGKIPEDADSQSLVRTICMNLGVAYPHGNIKEVMRILSGKRFLGWTHATAEEAQRFADLGVAAIGICEDKVVMICPDDKLFILTDRPEPAKAQNEYVKHIGDISPEEREKLKFYTYSYGHVLDKKQKKVKTK